MNDTILTVLRKLHIYGVCQSPYTYIIYSCYVIIARLVVVITDSGVDTFSVGASHNLTCTASGGASMTYTYQWLRYDGDIVGETSPTISFSPVWEADVGRYICRVSDGFTNITSDDVVINVEGKYNVYQLIILGIWDAKIPFYSFNTIS